MIAADPRAGRDGLRGRSGSRRRRGAGSEHHGRPQPRDDRAGGGAHRGFDGLQMDVDGGQLERDLCYGPVVLPDTDPAAPAGRMRLYLIDYPGESAQILTIAIVGPETRLRATSSRQATAHRGVRSRSTTRLIGDG